MADNRTIENALNGDRQSLIALMRKRAKWTPDDLASIGRGDDAVIERAMTLVREWHAVNVQRRADYEAASIVANPRNPSLGAVPVEVVGNHDDRTLAQLRKCLDHDDAVRGVICADGHLGYSQPVGAAVAYREHISVSGVGYDIACGNMAVRTSLPYSEIKSRVLSLGQDIAKNVSFGVGRTNNTKVDHPLFEDLDLWRRAGANDYKDKARDQLGTVGSGNHYVDLFEEEGTGLVWIGVHFGSRGLGHTLATKYLQLGGGRDGLDMPPTLLHQDSEIGQAYLAAMELAGLYAYAGREWVVSEVLRLLGNPEVTLSVHNHHNYAWREEIDGAPAWVVRKGCTPAYPGQMGFVGGSMGDHAVILRGTASQASSGLMNSTVHGAGRLKSRTAAKKEFTRQQMEEWLNARGVTLIGGDLDESPMAYRRLDEVLAAQGDTVEIMHRLRPFLVAMAGRGVKDPFAD